MAESITGSVSSKSKFLVQATDSSGTTYAGLPVQDFELLFGASVTKLYFATYSVTTSPTSIDLTSLIDTFGVAVNFATVLHLRVTNNDTTNSLTVGGGVNGLFTALPFSLRGQSGTPDNGSDLNLTTPITVDGTHKILTLVASAGTILVDVLIAGN